MQWLLYVLRLKGKLKFVNRIYVYVILAPKKKGPPPPKLHNPSGVYNGDAIQGELSLVFCAIRTGAIRDGWLFRHEDMHSYAMMLS